MTSPAHEAAAAVLAKAACYDQTLSRPDANVLRAWAEAIEQIPIEQALDAVAAHYRASDRRVMPADVVGYAKKAHAELVEREHSEQLRGRALGPSGGVDLHDGRRNSAELEQLHGTVNAVSPCSTCGAEQHDRCRRSDGVATKIPHWSRLKAARRADVAY